MKKIVQYVGVDTSFFAEEKEKLTKKLFYDIKDDLEKSEDYALEAKKKFLSALSSSGLSDTEEAKKFLSIINDKLKSFATEQKNILEEATLRIKPVIILIEVIAFVVFIACLPYWDSWNWWGLKGLVTVWPFVLLSNLMIMITIRISQPIFTMLYFLCITAKCCLR